MWPKEEQMDLVETNGMRAARERASAAGTPPQGASALPVGTDAPRVRGRRCALTALSAAILLVFAVAAAGAAARPTEEIYVRGKTHSVLSGLPVFLGADQAI